MSQCVPSWDLDDNSFPLAVPSLELDGYDVAELTWQNGQLAMHELATKTSPVAVAGTLESVVNEAAFHFNPKPAADGADANGLAPWFDHHAAAVAMGVTVDALVPVRDHVLQEPVPVPEIGASECGESTRVGSCSGATVPGIENESNGRRIRDGHRQLTAGTTTSFDTCEVGFGVGGSTSTSVWSPENSHSSREYAKSTSVDDSWEVRGPKLPGQSHPKKRNGVVRVDSSRVEVQDLILNQGVGKSSVSARRNKASAIHSQSERRRRDRINQRMKTLQKMVPNSSKRDKASMLDEVIEYVKQLQVQLHMTQMFMSHQMMMFQQFLNMPMPMSVMGTMRIMDMVGRAQPLVPPATIGIPGPTLFMPNASWNNIPVANRLSSPDFLSTLLTSPIGNEAYCEMAALYQQFQHPFGSKK